jgi:hypothetical protein
VSHVGVGVVLLEKEVAEKASSRGSGAAPERVEALAGLTDADE